MKKINQWFLPLVIVVPVLGGLFLYKVRYDQSVRTPQMQVVEDFYRRYLGPSQNGDLKDAKTVAVGFFSKGLLKAWDENLQNCKTNAGTDICGWGADEDIFLQSQETDPKLNYDNSTFRVFNFKGGFVEANFNVYPNQLKGGKLDPYYDRRIRFYLIEENGKWVVDDMAYVLAAGPMSARQMMLDENKNFEKTYAPAKPFAMPKGWGVPVAMKDSICNKQGVDRFTTVADFDGDGELDTAKLLVDGKTKKLALWTQVSSEAKTKIIISTDSFDGKNDLGIKIAPVGNYRTVCGKGYIDCKGNDKQEIVLTSPAIDLYTCESANRYMYWDTSVKKFTEQWMSD